MPTDDKVAFYLRHRMLIEEWAALREQAAAELDEALSRAVGIGQPPDTPEIVEVGLDRRTPVYGISLQVPGAEVGPVWVALGWTRVRLLRPVGGDSWPYMGVRIPGATKGEAGYDTVKRLLRDAASKLGWTTSGDWVWFRYIQFEPGETDLDDYAARHVKELVEAWKFLQMEISGS
jgi:hypothetical protein